MSTEVTAHHQPPTSTTLATLQEVLYGGFSTSATAAGAAGSIAAGMVPVVGQIADARDTAAALTHLAQGRHGALSELAFAAVGWIPAVGDLAKARFLGRLARRGGEAAEALPPSPLRRTEAPTVTGTRSLPPGEGYTDKYGNIVYSTRGPKSEQALVLAHEQVHSFLSPRWSFLREFRADLRMTAYERSSLLRYLEEALAESYAQVKVHGLGALPDGLKFPLAHGYVELRDVATEAAIGSVTVGGAMYGVYLLTE